jgi:hypothetical protein
MLLTLVLISSSAPHLRIGDQVIKTVGMVARFGTAREVTLDELRVQLVFPRDEEADAFFRQSDQTPQGASGYAEYERRF